MGNMLISHLLYVDDVMFLGEWSIINMNGVVNLLHCFYMVSGLRINIH